MLVTWHFRLSIYISYQFLIYILRLFLTHIFFNKIHSFRITATTSPISMYVIITRTITIIIHKCQTFQFQFVVNREIYLENLGSI